MTPTAAEARTTRNKGASKDGALGSPAAKGSSPTLTDPRFAIAKNRSSSPSGTKTMMRMIDLMPSPNSEATIGPTDASASRPLPARILDGLKMADKRRRLRRRQEEWWPFSRSRISLPVLKKGTLFSCTAT